MTRSSLCTLASALLFLLPLDASAWTLGFGGQVYRDDANLETEKRIGPQSPREEDTDYLSDDLGSLGLYLLTGSERMRYGGGPRYYGTYDVLEPLSREEQEKLEEEGEEDVREPFVFGRLFDVYGTLEWRLPVIPKLDVVLGTQVGVSVLMPSGDLEEVIEKEQDDGASVSGLPRLGLLFGPSLGAAYTILPERLAVRLDLGARYNRMRLFRTEEEIDGVAYRLDWMLGILRYDAGLAVELSF